MKNGALILSIGGTIAALVQALGYAQHAGGIMLVANLTVIAIQLVSWYFARRGYRLITASGEALDKLATLFNVQRLKGETDVVFRRRIMREVGVQDRAWRL